MPITVEEAYRVLELEVGAPEEHVKKHYKRLALKTHPDKNPDDPEAGKKFLLISEAYKRITDPDSFKDEDDQGDMPGNEEEMEAMFNEMLAEMFGFSGFHGAHVPFELFQMFESMMGPDDDDYPGEGKFFSMPSGFAGGHPMMFSMHGEDDDGDEFFYMDEDDDDDEDEYFMSGGGNDMFEAMLLNEILGGRGGGGMGFPSARPKIQQGKATTGAKSKDKAANKKKKNTKKDKESKEKEERKSKDSPEENKSQPKATLNKAQSKAASSSRNGKEEEDWETADEDEDDEVLVEEEIRRYQGRKPNADLKSSASSKMEESFKKKSPTNGSSSAKNVASKKPTKGKPSKYFEDDDDDDDMNDQDLMEMMMNHMAMELGIPGGGDMLQFLMDSELGGEFDDEEEDDEDGKPSSKKQKKKKNNKKKNKTSKDVPEAILPPSSSSTVPSSSSAAAKRKKEEERLPGDDSIPSLESVSVKENLPQPSSAPSSNSSSSLNGIKVGDRVLVSKKHEGKVAFIGDVHYAKGKYVGVVMKDAAQGKNNGTVRGVEYFRCKSSEKGLMVPLMDVTLVK